MSVARSLVIGLSGALAVVVIGMLPVAPVDGFLLSLLHAPALGLAQLVTLLPEGVSSYLMLALSPETGGSAFQLSVFFMSLDLFGWFAVFALGHYLWTRRKRRPRHKGAV